MLFYQDPNSVLFTVIQMPSFWYGYCNSGGVVFNPPACVYDSGPLCNTGRLKSATLNVYCQRGSQAPGLGVIYSQDVTSLVTTLSNLTPPNGSNRYGATPYTVGGAYSSTSLKAVKIQIPQNDITSNFNMPALDALEMVQFDYAISFLELSFANNTSYVAVLGFGTFSLNVALAPSSPTNLQIISTRDLTSATVSPDLVLQWGASTQGSAPIAGYKVRWGTAKNALANTMTLHINPNNGNPNSNGLKYTAGTNTYQFAFPYGTLPPFPAGSASQYYFDVEAFDTGAASNTLFSGLQSKWYKNQWFPANTQLSACSLVSGNPVVLPINPLSGH